VAEYLHDTACCRTLFATHYHELTEIVKTRPSAENYSVSAKEHEGELVFFHAIERGAASESYGIACAKLAGVPESVVDRARTLLGAQRRLLWQDHACCGSTESAARASRSAHAGRASRGPSRSIAGRN
jgi:DNA mismatch repair ATPase MutS